MSKHIQAYFETESQAEGAKTSLLSFETEHLETGSLEHTLSSDRDLFGPIVANPAGGAPVFGGAAFGTSGFTGTTGPQTVVPLVAMDRDANGSLNNDEVNLESDEHQRDRREDAEASSSYDYNKLRYVLSASVKESEIDQIVSKLRSQGAYVEVLD
ncbi:hypothetical protein [Paenibacillus tuaregi]|uniref:hypothetical protein n=1 Tax=Paenibacillus tuaregi TaxID=1816681 RepID=UPI0008395831|nr:hypothetical protein [Paenibacillus tuaregi]